MTSIQVDEDFIENTVDLTEFHSDDYVDCLRNMSIKNKEVYLDQIHRFALNDDDCPVFDHMLDYCKRYTAGSILCSNKLQQNESEIAINWAGGLHHAKKCEASGFCYVNDCVLGIIEMLKTY